MQLRFLEKWQDDNPVVEDQEENNGKNNDDVCNKKT